MYEALLKATPEYQKIAASFAQPGQDNILLWCHNHPK